MPCRRSSSRLGPRAARGKVREERAPAGRPGRATVPTAAGDSAARRQVSTSTVAPVRADTDRDALPFCQLRIRAWNPVGTAPGLRAIRLPNPPRTLGEHLLVARYERGLRQRDVARDLGVDHFTLINWEK